MEFDKKNIFAIGLVFSLGLNIILSFLVFQDKILFNPPSIVAKNVYLQEEQTPQPIPTQEITSESGVMVEREYVIPVVRQNDPSNDGWMIRKWDGVYSNPERELFSETSGSENVWPANRNKFHNRECPTVNADEPSSYAIFENEELIFRVPFNEKWGGDLFKLSPYRLGTHDNLTFGPLRGNADGWDGEGCPWYLTDHLEILPKQEMSTYLSMLESRIKANNDVFDIKLIQIPSFRDPAKKVTVVQYGVSGIEGFTMLAFFTDDHVYEFNGGIDLTSVDMLQDIVSTIELK